MSDKLSVPVKNSDYINAEVYHKNLIIKRKEIEIDLLNYSIRELWSEIKLLEEKEVHLKG